MLSEFQFAVEDMKRSGGKSEKGKKKGRKRNKSDSGQDEPPAKMRKNTTSKKQPILAGSEQGIYQMLCGNFISPCKPIGIATHQANCLICGLGMRRLLFQNLIYPPTDFRHLLYVPSTVNGPPPVPLKPEDWYAQTGKEDKPKKTGSAATFHKALVASLKKETELYEAALEKIKVRSEYTKQKRSATKNKSETPELPKDLVKTPEHFTCKFCSTKHSSPCNILKSIIAKAFNKGIDNINAHGFVACLRESPEVFNLIQLYMANNSTVQFISNETLESVIEEKFGEGTVLKIHFRSHWSDNDKQTTFFFTALYDQDGADISDTTTFPAVAYGSQVSLENTDYAHCLGDFELRLILSCYLLKLLDDGIREYVEESNGKITLDQESTFKAFLSTDNDPWSLMGRLITMIMNHTGWKSGNLKLTTKGEKKKKPGKKPNSDSPTSKKKVTFADPNEDEGDEAESEEEVDEDTIPAWLQQYHKVQHSDEVNEEGEDEDEENDEDEEVKVVGEKKKSPQPTRKQPKQKLPQPDYQEDENDDTEPKKKREEPNENEDAEDEEIPQPKQKVKQPGKKPPPSKTNNDSDEEEEATLQKKSKSKEVKKPSDTPSTKKIAESKSAKKEEDEDGMEVDQEPVQPKKDPKKDTGGKAFNIKASGGTKNQPLPNSSSSSSSTTTTTTTTPTTSTPIKSLAPSFLGIAGQLQSKPAQQPAKQPRVQPNSSLIPLPSSSASSASSSSSSASSSSSSSSPPPSSSQSKDVVGPSLGEKNKEAKYKLFIKYQREWYNLYGQGSSVDTDEKLMDADSFWKFNEYLVTLGAVHDKMTLPALIVSSDQAQLESEIQKIAAVLTEYHLTPTASTWNVSYQELGPFFENFATILLDIAAHPDQFGAVVPPLAISDSVSKLISASTSIFPSYKKKYGDFWRIFFDNPDKLQTEIPPTPDGLTKFVITKFLKLGWIIFPSVEFFEALGIELDVVDDAKKKDEEEGMDVDK